MKQMLSDEISYAIVHILMITVRDFVLQIMKKMKITRP